MPDNILRDVMSEQMRNSPIGPFIMPIVTMLQSGLGKMHGEREFHSGHRVPSGHNEGMPGRE